MPEDLLNDVALQNILANLEIERAKIAKAQTKGYVFILAGIVLGFLGAILGFPTPAIILGVISATTGGVFLYRISDALGKYKSSFKLDVIGHALRFFR